MNSAMNTCVWFTHLIYLHHVNPIFGSSKAIPALNMYALYRINSLAWSLHKWHGVFTFRLAIFAALDSKASNLSVISQKYRKDARYLNLRSTYAKIAAIVIVIIVLLLFLRYTIWWSVISASTEKADIVRTWNQCCVMWLFLEI